MRVLLSLACLILAASTAAAQTRTLRGFVMGGGGGSDGKSAWGTAQVIVPPFVPPAVIGAPFSGEETQRQVQVLADGTRITRPLNSGAKVFRDSEGRTRIERSLFGSPATRPGSTVAPIEIVEINDPGQGVYYLLDVSKKVAYRLKYTPARPPDRTKQAPPRATGPPRETATKAGGISMTPEDLGLRVINGLQAQGRRMTTVIPENFQGNDRPMTQVSEEWTAVQLQIPILSINKSAQSGESTFELTNVSLASPSPLLFSPPPDYAVQDQQSPFTAEFGQRPPGAMTVISSGTSTVVVGKQ